MPFLGFHWRSNLEQEKRRRLFFQSAAQRSRHSTPWCSSSPKYKIQWNLPASCAVVSQSQKQSPESSALYPVPRTHEESYYYVELSESKHGRRSRCPSETGEREVEEDSWRVLVPAVSATHTGAVPNDGARGHGNGQKQE